MIGTLAAGAIVLLLSSAACAPRTSVAPPSGSRPGLAPVLASLVWPLRFDGRGNVSSRYGYRAWGGGFDRYHYGLDLHARRGTPVYSAGDGIVTSAGEGGAYGRYLEVEHGQGLSTFYAHLERLLVSRGRRVRHGEVIGLVGSTGNATGPHLHFELRLGERRVDPLVVLPRLE